MHTPAAVVNTVTMSHYVPLLDFEFLIVLIVFSVIFLTVKTAFIYLNYQQRNENLTRYQQQTQRARKKVKNVKKLNTEKGTKRLILWWNVTYLLLRSLGRHAKFVGLSLRCTNVTYNIIS